VLGATFAVLSALSFAINNAAARRGVITGTPIQGMAVTVPMGIALFLLLAIVTGEILRWAQYPPRAAAWMAGVGLVHFIFGRYCNYKANQVAGVNLTAPVVQLQVIVTLVFAVVILKEPCTVLQMIGGALILAGSLLTQRQPPTRRDAAKPPVFVPRYLLGYLFASLAALGYGTSPIMARFALADSGPVSGILGGLIAYGAATAFVAIALLWPPVRHDVTALKRENLPWFAYSGLFVAMAQGFFYAAVAVAPIMLVMPILQMSLVFRLIISTWLNPDHEVFGPIVIAGAAVAMVGSLTVAVETDFILSALSVPDALGSMLRWRV
jgi:drug/metabolite transporter (DMT)-like permease